jgi:hypothetical protein
MMDKQAMEKKQHQQGKQNKKGQEMGMMGKKAEMGKQGKEGGKHSKMGGMKGSQGKCPMCGKKMEGEMGPNRGKGPAKPTDDRLKSVIEFSLTEDSWLDASKIQVAVKDGVVTLTGKVDKWDSKRHAEDLALRPMGVTDVKNELELEDQQSK